MSAKIFKTQEEIDNLLKMYNDGMSIRQIAKIYNRCYAVIQDTLKRNGCIFRSRYQHAIKYYYNENYFDQIDTEDKAYFFGLLFADGCNLYNRHEVIISLQERDKEILEKFAKCLNTNRSPRLISAFGKRFYKTDQYRLEIRNKHISEILNNYGLVPRKTLIKKFPEVIFNSNEDIIRHFIRGYFDGNGSVSAILKEDYDLIDDSNFIKSVTCSIASTKKMCCALQYLLYKYCNVESKIRKHTTHNVYYITPIGGYNTFKMLRWLYKYSYYRIIRKFDKYILVDHYIKTKKYSFRILKPSLFRVQTSLLTLL